ncbi:dihydropyrimidinase [Clostridium septicum]|uniref:Dihydropyrimidinase n=1 Tax=Clostridium septicum TaxID=1504 RepID=A0A9N7JP33_CLOSE|nr:dihydropyrimidinase [Clostridium septicum]AYE35589.1 dihydropyrimidinase [Clostridium septicum]MDU1313183.1 dihydropyrimidinase [Clostridium septicum]QAS60975.1 dihydropyrimidinase [Clostridium septicum]UEC19747.1 dihydropyrimidinase [Clostridium septicum]USS02193.1 dihydropyrimidinase [Clostridium septicum]
MSLFDSVIKNGTIVNASDVYRGDIGIKDGKILAISKELEYNAQNIIDATGKYVFPGGIDPHTHMEMPFGGTFSSDDFITGTKAAACGGTTTIIDFAVQPTGKTLNETAKIWRDKADNRTCIDYGIHIVITDMNGNIMNEIPDVINKGYSSFKVFMTYEGMRIDDEILMKTLLKVSENGGLTCVHAENYYVIKYLTEKLLSEGKTEPLYHALSRPDLCEAEAVSRSIKMAELCKTPLYIVHNSCKKSVIEIKRAREEGYHVIGETCPQYLLLSTDNYKEPNFNGAKYVMSPPLRDKENWKYMWEALKKDNLQVIATDHCPFFMNQKKLGINNFTKIPNGAPGVELRMALIYTYGVLENNMSLSRFVEVTSTNAAKIFGLYPQKGSIVVGSDADLVVFDPNKETVVTKSMLNENVDYTPYEGFKLKGYPELTLLRGEIIAKDGKYLGKEGSGRFIKRGAPLLV